MTEAEAAKRLEQFQAAKPRVEGKELPTGIYVNGKKFSANMKKADGRWTMKSFPTIEEAVKARDEAYAKYGHIKDTSRKPRKRKKV